MSKPLTPPEWFDRPRQAALREAYNIAVKEKSEKFTFEGHELYTPYAKYLLEWLDMELGT